MYVKSIELKNFKVISELSESFNGGIYLVKGENELGKSTLMNSVTSLLTGDRTENLLQKGKEKGHAKIVVGEKDDPNGYEVELKFSEKNPRGTIRVTHLETGMRSDNKSFLNKIFDYQEFDANQFVRWSESAEGRRKQVQIIKSLLPESIVHKIEKLEQDIKAEKADRKEYNATESYLLGKIDATVDLSILDKDVPKTSDIETELKNAFSFNQKRSEIETSLEQLKTTVANYPVRSNSIKEVQKKYESEYSSKLDQLKKDYERSVEEAKMNHEGLMGSALNELEQIRVNEIRDKEQAAKFEKYLSENEVKNTAEISAKMTSVNEIISQRNIAQIQKDKKQELENIQATIAKANETIQASTEEKKILLKENPLPIDGLTFDDEGLYLNGIRVRQGDISTSQEIELAVKVIMAKNTKVKVFKIGQGESLGRERFNRIIEFAKENGYQGFVEMVELDNQELTIEEYTERD